MRTFYIRYRHSSPKSQTVRTPEFFSETNSEMSTGPAIIPDAISPTTTEQEGLVDLGLFSLIHSPVDYKIRTQICNKEYIDLAKFIFTDDVGEMTTIT